MRFCPFCGAQVDASNKFCSSCGKPIGVAQTAPAAPPQPGRVTPDMSDEHTQLAPTSGTEVMPDQDDTQLAPTAASSWSISQESHPSDDEETRVVTPRSSSTHDAPRFSQQQGFTGSTSTTDAHTVRPADGDGPAANPWTPTTSSSTESGSSFNQGSARVDGSSARLSDGGTSPSDHNRGSSIARMGAAVLAVVVLGGGAAFAYNAMKGDDTSTSSSQSSSNASSNSSGGAAAPTNAAQKPSKMPDLKGKSVDEAQALLSSEVKIETAKTNLVEGMNGGAVISAQETAAGKPTPDTVKVTVDQPANVTYVSTSSDLIVDSNPLSNSSGQVPNKTYEHMMTGSMSGYDDKPETLELNLNRAYSRLRGDVAIDSQADDKDKQFKVTIRGDGHQLWQQTIKFGDAPRSLDLDVTNVLRLEIEISVSGGTEENQYKSSQIDFGDLRVLAEPGKGNYSSPASSS